MNSTYVDLLIAFGKLVMLIYLNVTFDFSMGFSPLKLLFLHGTPFLNYKHSLESIYAPPPPHHNLSI